MVLDLNNLRVVDKGAVLSYALSLVKNKYNHVLEFGVYKGNSLKIIKQTLGGKYKFFGFDSFEGLPENWENTNCYKGQFSTDGAIPNIRGVQFYKGWFTDTLPQYLDTAQNIAFLHIDCDLYSSTVEVFEALNPYICPGTIILFDEWLYWSWPRKEYLGDCEQKAFYEWAGKYKREYELINYKEVKNITDSDIAIEQQIVKILK